MSEIQHNVSTTVGRIIAKIDNDFNPDNSDWIPRVGPWCIDAMSQLNVLPTKKKRVKFKVNERIIYSDCYKFTNNIKVYDKKGCEIKEAKYSGCGCGYPSTGEETETNTIMTTDTVNYGFSDAKQEFITYINDNPKEKYSNRIISISSDNCNRNYVIIDDNKLELSFDTDYIIIELDVIESIFCDEYNCYVPVIPNNGILIEAIVYYCMYKMLCRGYIHPVFNLKASQYGTNPYYMWTTMKEEAKRSVLNNNIDEDISSLFRSNFFINTFDPRK